MVFPQTFSRRIIRTALGGQPAAEVLPCAMLYGLVPVLLTIEQPYYSAALHNVVMTAQHDTILEIRCPTCGAKPGEKCELNAGLSSTEPHPDRRLAAAEKSATHINAGDGLIFEDVGDAY
jgi:hypothetical protein